MRTAFVIAKREFGSFFKSPIGYVVLCVFLIVASVFFFFGGFFSGGHAGMEGFFGTMPILYVIFVPAISMRLLAEERGSGTIEMLLTMPVRDSEVVIGKFLAGLGLLAIGILLTVPVAVTVSMLGPMDWGPAIGGFIGTLFLGATYLAVGLFASALTKSQIIAFIAGVGMCLGLFLLGYAAPRAPASISSVLEYISPQFHFTGIQRGVIELRSVIYYLSTTAVLMLLSTQALESRKWR